MAKRQLRIRNVAMEQAKTQWLGHTVSVMLHTGVVYEVCAHTLEAGVLHGRDGLRIEHAFPLHDIKEIILYFPVAEHAQTSAD